MRKSVLLFFTIVCILTMLLALTSCGDAGSQSAIGGNIHVHEYGEWKTIEPTCTTPGSRSRKCSCGDEERETYPALGHDTEFVAAVESTCYTAGKASYWRCKNCERVFADRTAKAAIDEESLIIPNLEHRLYYRLATESSCVKYGNIRYCVCSLCGDIFSADESHEPLQEEDVLLPFKSHQMNHVEEVESSCSETGVVEHWRCDRCGLCYADEEGTNVLEDMTMPKKAHDYVDGICSVCGEKDSYTVHFNAAGGREIADIEVKKEQPFGSIPITRKENSSFCGWYQEDGTPWFFEDVVTEEMTLFARFVPATATYMALPVRLGATQEETLRYGVTGYTAQKYYSEKECRKEAVFGDRTVPVCYLKYSPITISVTLSAEGGYFATENGYTRSFTKEAYYLDEITLPTPVKKGFEFLAWLEGEDALSGDTLMIDSLNSRMLTATWDSVCAHDLLTKVEERQPKCLEDGNIAYYYCSNCGGKYSDEECTIDNFDVSLPATGHKGGEANCKEKAMCVVCGEEYGEKTSHYGGTATCSRRAVCAFCKEEYGDLKEHMGGRATCCSLAICDECGKEYGDYADHVEEDLICDKDVFCSVCGSWLKEAEVYHQYKNGVCTRCGATESLSYAYSVDLCGYLVTGCVGTNTDLVIPSWIDRVQVVGIKEGAFFGKTELRTVKIPSSITYFGENAFYNCAGMIAVYIEDRIGWQTAEFGNAAANPLTYAGNLYEGKTKLTSLTIGECEEVEAYAYSHLSVDSIVIEVGAYYIGERAFYGITAETTILVWEQNLCPLWSERWLEGSSARFIEDKNNVKTSGDYTYRLENGKAYLLSYSGEDIFVNVPDRLDNYPVADIGTAFAGRNNIVAVMLPTTLEYFRENSFDGCIDLEGVLYAGTRAQWVSNLKADADRSILYYTEETCVHDEYTYYSYGKHRSIVLKEVQPNLTRAARCDVDDLSEPVLCAICGKPISVEYEDVIREHHYENGVCTVCGEKEPTVQLTYSYEQGGYFVTGYETEPIGEIVIPSLYAGKQVIGIYTEAFSGCEGITALYLPRTLKYMGQNVFDGCTSLRSVYYDCEDCQTVAGETVFAQNDGIIVTIGEHAETVPAYLFYKANVKGITFKEGGKCRFIGNFAFAYNPSLQVLSLPVFVREISFGAFKGCEGLTTLYAPESVLFIGRSAFKKCSSFSSVIMGERVQGIHATAFLGTTWYNMQQEGIVYIGKTACFIKGEAEEIEIEEGTEYIGENAFMSHGASKVTIPSSVLYIGENAFADMPLLAEVIFLADKCKDVDKGKSVFSGSGTQNGISVTFGENVKRIPAYLFNGATRIKEIEGDNIEEVGEEALTGTEYLSAQTGAVYVGKALYLVKNGKGKVVVQTGTVTITAGAFVGQTAITEIELPSSLKKIGAGAFDGCSGITRIAYAVRNLTVEEDSVLFAEVGSSKGWTLSIDKNVILPAYLCYQAKNLTAVIFENDSLVETIPSYAFAECENLSEVSLPDSVTTVCENAFSWSGLETLSVGAGIESITGAAFLDCPLSAITSTSSRFVVEGGVLIDSETSVLVVGTKIATGSAGATAIGDYAFFGRKFLRSFSIGDDVISIGEKAFYECTGLHSLIIGKSVTSIDSEAFYGCQGLTEINFSALNCPDITEGSKLFEGVSGVKIYIRRDVTYLPENLFIDIDEIRYLLVENSLEEIGHMCLIFENDTLLYYAGTAEEWANVTINYANYIPTDNVLFYSDIEPEKDDETGEYIGSFWKYDGGLPVAW